MRTCLAALVASVALAATAHVAHAHQASATFARLETTDHPARIRYEIQLAARDLFEALALESDREATSAEIVAGRSRLVAYLQERLAFEADGRACRTEPLATDVVDQGQRFARVVFDVVCPAPVGELALEYELFHDIDPRHIGFVALAGATARLTAPDDTRLVWRIGEPPPSSFLAFVKSGIEHILFGLDHILFLVSLLLMAVIARGSGGGRRPVAVVRPLREALAYTASIVTSFTVAHSVTLIGAALGWFELPGRLVESVIAASITFVAVDNAIRLDPPRRYLVTFGFGLIHGLGFASMLRPLLPPEDVIVPLLAFNLGVELGQLGLVLLALPVLYLLVSRLGAAGYRRVVLPVGAVVLGGLGIVWLVERAADVTILGL